MWEEVAKFIGETAVLIAAMAWLVRSITTHLLSKNVERFKQELKTEAEKELAELKSHLEIENAKQHIRLTALQARRIELLEQVYARLLEFSGEAECFAVEPLLGDEKTLKEKADKFIGKFLDFYQYFEKHEIFFPKDIEDQIKSLHKSYFEAALTINYQHGDEFKKAITALKENYQSIMESNNNIRRRLAEHFRKLLGVES